MVHSTREENDGRIKIVQTLMQAKIYSPHFISKLTELAFASKGDDTEPLYSLGDIIDTWTDYSLSGGVVHNTSYLYFKVKQ
jgi:hypothetical protein